MEGILVRQDAVVLSFATELDSRDTEISFITSEWKLVSHEKMRTKSFQDLEMTYLNSIWNERTCDYILIEYFILRQIATVSFFTDIPAVIFIFLIFFLIFIIFHIHVYTDYKLYIYFIYIYFFHSRNYYHNCRFNARSYFERVLVL